MAGAQEIKRIGRYDIERVLGEGAMGVVYEGRDTRLHRKVAIKTILKSALDSASSREYSMRFAREAQAVARLNHPNIVQVFDFAEEGDVAYIVMELVRGRELKTFFDAKERFELKEIVHIMGELCEALHFAHEAAIVHRDIKPANVMIDSQGRVKLTDFGVARIADPERTLSDKTQAGAVVGTSSLRRAAQIAERHAKLELRALRGNVDTRLAKLDRGEYAAIVLAAAGLRRLGLASRIRGLLEAEESLPAAGQGALGIECRADRPELLAALAPLAHAATADCVRAERAVNRVLGGNCAIPLGAYATVDRGMMRLRALVAAPDGSRAARAESTGPAAQADALGAEVAQLLRERGATEILAALPA